MAEQDDPGTDITPVRKEEHGIKRFEFESLFVQQGMGHGSDMALIYLRGSDEAPMSEVAPVLRAVRQFLDKRGYDMQAIGNVFRHDRARGMMIEQDDDAMFIDDEDVIALGPVAFIVSPRSGEFGEGFKPQALNSGEETSPLALPESGSEINGTEGFLSQLVSGAALYAAPAESLRTLFE